MMEKFGKKQLAAYGLGAIGKDMIYALSASYVMYYYQDLLGLQASFVGLILMIARIFDAVNDPFMGVVVAKTNTKWGKFRPWLFTGTILNALVIYALFAAPNLDKGALMVYFAVMYILWGITYTMMDIPFWSIIPAVTSQPQDRENLSVVGRTFAGVGNALIAVLTVMAVSLFGAGNEILGFKRFTLMVAVVFVVLISYMCWVIKEEKVEQMDTTSVGEMFSALFKNDQAMITVLTIVLINTALYITSNLIIYFFKYDISGESWKATYTLFTTMGGLAQILGMMVLYPLLRKKYSNTMIFKLCAFAAIIGYAILFIAGMLGLNQSFVMLMLPGILIFTGNGILTVLTTIFLSLSVDYGELKSGHRDESVIFSMQTFVVKAASGLAVFLTGIGLDMIGLVGNSGDTGEIVSQSATTLSGLRFMMTVIPMVGLLAAYYVFKRYFILTDEKALEMSQALVEKHQTK
ncbi:glycoside-pentoside-hexuronide (GPH):cation symporter [Tuanshanicoccus lijuaniae]|uniref:glycoside-pentoside-hexuronide (GPH):cation symporter n=1 Tax=Aerococcaceae bacterium zg-1292 TaxID=2774330 RepID=UPI001BD87690|nr:glycoside-pentoside-hexuronide (GPH):cation symporter [Aerococcaceae bacterium zg-A91]MBS4457526.1 glycoside-pentoside-hexuronide (GPH):cation symporter [Aerococcaceae bacterium zg-BR33]